MEHIDLPGFTRQAMKHAQRPRNKGVLPEFNAEGRIAGPCGDTMAVWLNIKDEAIQNASFYTTGCGSSLACGSMTTCLALGKPIVEAARLSPQDILDALGGMPPELEHCALLAVNTLKAACEDYLEKQKGD